MKSTPVLAIAAGAGVGSFAMNFWIPFIPLYMLDLGATSDANALFWVGIATTFQGIARLVTGPLWGILSDRVGRKAMFVRALAFATITTGIAAFATEPWHVVVAFICQGLFSGFVPAAVALTSVTVSDERLNSSLSVVTGSQYLGSTLGPAVGSALAVVFDLRGAIVAAAIMPALAATAVLLLVPRDRTGRAALDGAGEHEAEGAPSAAPNFWRSLSFQFGLVLFLYFFLFGASQLVRLVTPLAMENLHGTGDVESIVGAAFSLAGIVSVAGIMIVGRRFFVAGRFRTMLAAGCVAVGFSQVLLAVAPNVPLYIVWFSMISLLQAAMLPATNTLIAANVPRERRGTAFGLAGSAQALAFMVGPMTAAAFAATSMGAGLAGLGVAFGLLGAFVLWRLREPEGLRAPSTTPTL